MRGHSFTGAVIACREDSGATVSRIIHPPGQDITPHQHDWPVLIMCRIGHYREFSETMDVVIDGPAVGFQPAGAAHADNIGESGLETLTMSFDPRWLDAEARAILSDQIVWRFDGAVIAQARAVAKLWETPEAPESAVQAATSNFVLSIFHQDAPPPPRWSDELQTVLAAEDASNKFAAEFLDRNPAWLTRAWRTWRGEGIAETIRRRRIERAVLRLRQSDDPIADIAAECGFCDQSHMNRIFRKVLGRTPLAVRREASLLAPLTMD